MAYVSRSCDFWKVKMGRWSAYIIKFPFKVILMDYVSRFSILEIPKIPEKYLKLLKKEILMAYISRSCDFPKVKMGRWVDYIIK
jgi:hypothetical protein